MPFVWTKRAIEQLVWDTLEGADPHQIAARLHCNVRTVRDMQWELELSPRPHVHRWTRKERATLRRMYEHSRTEEIAKVLGVTPAQIWREARRLNLRKDVEVIREMARERSARPDHGGAAHRFKKGQIPPNKGLRRPGYAPGRMATTQFKKGNRPQTWMPIGSTRFSKDGYLQRKVADTGYPPRDWVAVHNLLWIEKHGPIPPGHAVAFRDGNKGNIVDDNLELVSRAELMRRNSIHNRYPKEVVNTIMLLGAVKRRLRERANAA
jgi:DNA-binding CsgD family transcriptional regulator